MRDQIFEKMKKLHEIAQERPAESGEPEPDKLTTETFLEALPRYR